MFSLNGFQKALKVDSIDALIRYALEDDNHKLTGQTSEIYSRTTRTYAMFLTASRRADSSLGNLLEEAPAALFSRDLRDGAFERTRGSYSRRIPRRAAPPRETMLRRKHCVSSH